MFHHLNLHTAAPYLMIGGTVAIVAVGLAFVWFGLDLTNMAAE